MTACLDGGRVLELGRFQAGPRGGGSEGGCPPYRTTDGRRRRLIS
jgi:hypothetical protein